MIEIIRRFGLTGTELERAQAGTVRGKLLKIAGSIRVTTRRVWISLSSAYPLAVPLPEGRSQTRGRRRVAAPSPV